MVREIQMNDTMPAKQQYLVDFTKNICTLYIKEKLYLQNSRNLNKHIQLLSNKEIKKLHVLLADKERRILFIEFENIMYNHINYILPAIEAIINKMPREIHELIKMELRDKNLLHDQIVPPGEDFTLELEIERLIKVETIDQYTKGRTIVIEQPTSNMSSKLTRSARYAAILEAIQTLYNSNILENLCTSGFNKNFLESVWKINILATEIQMLPVNTQLNELFANYTKKSFLKEYCAPLQHLKFMIDILLTTQNYILDPSCKISEQIKQHALQTSIELKNISTTLAQFAESYTTIKDTLKQESCGNYMLILNKMLKIKDESKFTIPDIKIMLHTLTPIKKPNTWHQLFNITEFNRNFPDADIICKEEDSKTILQIAGNIGKALVEVYFSNTSKEPGQHISFKLLEENIRQESCFIQSKRLLIGFAACFEKDNYEKIKIRCNIPEVAKDLCALAFEYHVKYVELEDSTEHNIIKYGIQDPDILYLTIDPELQILMHQFQNVLTLGFIPDISEEAKETLRIKSMAHKNLDTNKINPGLHVTINHYNPIITMLQIKYCYETGLDIYLPEACIKKLDKHLSKNEVTAEVPIRALTYYDIKKRIQYSLNLGLIPKIQDPNSMHLLKKNYSKKTVFHFFKIDINNMDIAYEQFKFCMNQGILVRFQNANLSDKIFRHAKKYDLETDICINFSEPLAAIEAAIYTCKAGFQFHFHFNTRDIILNYIIQLNNIKALPLVKFDSPTFIDFKKALENCMLLELNENAIKSIIKSLNLRDNADLKIEFLNYPAHAHDLLLSQVEQIEHINQYSNQPISYCCDDITEENNSIQLYKKLNLIIHKLPQPEVSASDNENMELVDELTRALQIIVDNPSLSPYVKITSIEKEISLDKYHIKHFKKIIDIYTKNLFMLKRQINGLLFNTNKILISAIKHRDKQKYTKLAEHYANNIQKSLFNKAQQISAAKPKIGSSIIDIDSLLIHYKNIVPQPYVDNVKLINSSDALSKIQIEQLTEESVLERLQVLGKRIADGLEIDELMQQELKALSHRRLSLGPIILSQDSKEH